MSSMTIKVYNITCLLISLSVIMLIIISSIHADNETLSNAEENYISCSNGFPKDCDGFDNVKGTIVKIKENNSDVTHTCVIRFQDLETLNIQCVNVNGKNYNYTRYVVSKEIKEIGEIMFYTLFILLVCIVLYLLYFLLTKIPWFIFCVTYLLSKFIVNTTLLIYNKIKQKYFHERQD